MRPETIEIVLAGLNVDRDVRDAITGDLIEARAKLAALRGARSADHWMRQQILRSVPAFVRAAVMAGGLRLMAAVIGAALAALAAVAVLVGASVALLGALISPETMARFVVVALAIDLGYGTAGGYLAARIGGAAPLGASFVFGLLSVSVTALLSGGTQGWYGPVLSVLLIPATVSGGWLRARDLARRTRAT